MHLRPLERIQRVPGSLPHRLPRWMLDCRIVPVDVYARRLRELRHRGDYACERLLLRGRERGMPLVIPLDMEGRLGDQFADDAGARWHEGVEGGAGKYQSLEGAPQLALEIGGGGSVSHGVR